VNIIKFIEIFPDEKSFKDYYAFGYLMPGRESYITDYRFGFNGMEKDDEIGSIGNSYNFGARIFDSRIGRFLSIDPFANNFPFMTPYCFAANSPIKFIDTYGLGPEDAGKIKDYLNKILTLAPIRIAQAYVDYYAEQMKSRYDNLDITDVRAYDNRFETIIAPEFEFDERAVFNSNSSDAVLVNFTLDGLSLNGVKITNGEIVFNIGKGKHRHSVDLVYFHGITSGGGFGGLGNMIDFRNTEQNSAFLLLISSEEEFLQVKNAFYQKVADEKSRLLKDNPMLREYIEWSELENDAAELYRNVKVEYTKDYESEAY